MGSVAKKIKKAVKKRAGVNQTVEQMVQERRMQECQTKMTEEATIEKEMAELGEKVVVCTQQTLGPEAVLNGTEGGDDSAGNDNE